MGQAVELLKRRRRAPNAENGKVDPPRRRPNRDSRTREYLAPSEMERLLDAAAAGRHGPRDRTLLLLMYRHGLRVSEAISLRRDWPDTPYLFVSERGGPMTASNVRKLAARSGLAAKIP